MIAMRRCRLAGDCHLQTGSDFEKMEEEYKDAVAVKMGRFQDASFGKSVDIDGNLIVVGAPQENENQRSTTVFQKDTESGEWMQVEKIEPEDLCPTEYYGYSVQAYGDLIAASADCETNIKLYQLGRRRWRPEAISTNRSIENNQSSDANDDDSNLQCLWICRQWQSIIKLKLTSTIKRNSRGVK